MKNYLLFIVDSLNYTHVQNSQVELMPFLQKLKRQGIFCENMFAQAPYTEAAVMNIYCGQDVLQNGGYLYRFRDTPLTLFEAMKKKGYRTFYNSYQPQCHPSSVRRGIDDLYYNIGFDIGALWSYRLEHYSQLYRKKQLTRHDMLAVQELLDDNFQSWIRFTDDLIHGDPSVELICENTADYDAKAVKAAVKEAYAQYKKDPEAYLDTLLTTGTAHPLFHIPAFIQNRKIKDRKAMDAIRSEIRPVLKRIERMNFCCNIRNEKNLFHGPIRKMKQMICHPSKEAVKDFIKSGYLSCNALFDLDLFQRSSADYDTFKNAPSARTHIDHYIRWAKQQKSDQPHFGCIHVDDIHNPEVFFTYDTSDISLIRKEMEEAREVLNRIPSDYHGSLTHDLSLRYMDGVIAYLYEQLEQNRLLENTCVAICADHGFSFSGNPLRDSFVINLFLENYRIPFVITGTQHCPTAISRLCASKDIPATICQLAVGEVPPAFSGHSVLDKEEYPCVRIEYCGGGCPDLRRRELKIAAFNRHYFVGTQCLLDEPIDCSSVTEVYDLDKDPLQFHNLVRKCCIPSEAQPLINAIIQRKREIKQSIPS